MTRRPLIVIVLATVLLFAGGPAFRGKAAADPIVTHDCTPAPQDCSGWYRSDVSIKWTVGPATATPTGCTDKRLTTDTTGSYEACSVFDLVRVTVELWIKVDKSPPLVTGAGVSRSPDANGWYRTPVGIAFHGSDATSGLRDCTGTTYAGPDSAEAQAQGTCTDVAGNTSAPSAFPLRYDATGPAVRSGEPVRKPDHGRWYTEPVKWRFHGRDALSGIAECPSVLYGGPDGRAAGVSGACRDNAGNVSTRTFSFRYDATPPAPPAVTALPRDHAVRLQIAVAPDVRSIAIRRIAGARRTIYRGRPKSFTDVHARNGKRYRYTVVARDQAANVSSSTIAAVPNPRLLAPPAGAVLNSPPLMRWTPVRNADYFNVQLRRDGHKVLSRWPRRARLQLRRTWRFRGRVEQLAPGRYVWDVWPGFGARHAAKYGARIGRGSFVVAAAP